MNIVKAMSTLYNVTSSIAGNLARIEFGNWVQNRLFKCIGGFQFGGSAYVHTRMKYWWILIWRLQSPTTKPFNSLPNIPAIHIELIP